MTMQRTPLLMHRLTDRGARVAPGETVVTLKADGVHRQTLAETRQRACQLANALGEHGTVEGDRVASFQWNNHRHLEMYQAVPSMGAVLHTLNLHWYRVFDGRSTRLCTSSHVLTVAPIDQRDTKRVGTLGTDGVCRPPYAAAAITAAHSKGNPEHFAPVEFLSAPTRCPDPRAGSVLSVSPCTLSRCEISLGAIGEKEKAGVTTMFDET